LKNFLYKEIKIFSCIIIVYVLMLVSCNSATALVIKGGQHGLEANEEFHGCETTPVCLNGNWPQQKATNWCLATCMNIVYRDCLAYRGGTQVFGPEPTTDLFAELAFVLAPGELSIINFEILQPDAQAYLRNHFGLIEFKNPAQQISAISGHFKGLSREERNNIWNGGNFRPGTLAQNFGLLTGDPQAGLAAMPQEIKNSINTTVESVNIIFNQMLTRNPNFAQHHEIVNSPGANPWQAMFNDIWDRQHIVIVNMVYDNGARHSLAAYGACRSHTDTGDVDRIMIYDPSDGYNNVLVNVDSRDTVRLHERNAKIDSFIVFDY
jgi:hypothetical protein